MYPTRYHNVRASIVLVTANWITTEVSIRDCVTSQLRRVLPDCINASRRRPLSKRSSRSHPCHSRSITTFRATRRFTEPQATIEAWDGHPRGRATPEKLFRTACVREAATSTISKPPATTPHATKYYRSMHTFPHVFQRELAQNSANEAESVQHAERASFKHMAAQILVAV